MVTHQTHTLLTHIVAYIVAKMMYDPYDPITIDPITNPFWDNQGDISKLSAFSGSSEILLMPNIRMRVGATFPKGEEW